MRAAAGRGGSAAEAASRPVAELLERRRQRRLGGGGLGRRRLSALQCRRPGAILLSSHTRFTHRTEIRGSCQRTRIDQSVRCYMAARRLDGTVRQHKNTHTHPFNGPLSRTTVVSRCQKGKTNQDFTEARDSDWQWHQLGHMQVYTLLQTDNHASTPPLSFYRPDALPAAQPTGSKH